MESTFISLDKAHEKIAELRGSLEEWKLDLGSLTAQLATERTLRERAEADYGALKLAAGDMSRVLQAGYVNPEEYQQTLTELERILSQPHPGDAIREELERLRFLQEAKTVTAYMPTAAEYACICDLLGVPSDGKGDIVSKLEGLQAEAKRYREVYEAALEWVANRVLCEVDLDNHLPDKTAREDALYEAVVECSNAKERLLIAKGAALNPPQKGDAK
jgi:hypothetical protein